MKRFVLQILTLYISRFYLLNRFMASTALTIVTPEALHIPAHQLVLITNVRYIFMLKTKVKQIISYLSINNEY